ncbi:MAG: YigZ family protein [Clostridia bacterium]
MQYLTLDGEFSSKYEILHSVFICHIKGISSFEEGLEYVSKISKKYNDATHNCYGIVTINGQQKLSDDGEPGGTAGMPIGQVIKMQNLTNVVAVVTRYFGGVKLGVGGLVSAYTQSVVDALKVSNIVSMELSRVVSVNFDYACYSAFLNFLNGIKSKVLDTVFDNEVTLQFAFPVELENQISNKIAELTSGKSELIFETENKYYKY